jgi:hypothetical protein
MGGQIFRILESVFCEWKSYLMTEHQVSESRVEAPFRTLPAPVSSPSIVKWHLGALLFLVGGGLLIANLEDFKDYSASKEPLEYVFSAVWNFFLNFLPNFVYFLIGVSGIKVMLKHRHWTLPEFNRLSAVVLLALISLPMLLVAAGLSIEAFNGWLAAFQAGEPKHGKLLSLIVFLLVGAPWVFSQYRAWRTLLFR